MNAVSKLAETFFGNFEKKAAGAQETDLQGLDKALAEGASAPALRPLRPPVPKPASTPDPQEDALEETLDAFRSSAYVPEEERAKLRAAEAKREQAPASLLDRIHFHIGPYVTIKKGDNGEEESARVFEEYLRKLSTALPDGMTLEELVKLKIKEGEIALEWCFCVPGGKPDQFVSLGSMESLEKDLEKYIARVREEMAEENRRSQKSKEEAAAASGTTATISMSPAQLRTILDINVPEDREVFLEEFVQTNIAALSPEAIKGIVDALAPDQKKMFLKYLARHSSATPS